MPISTRQVSLASQALSVSHSSADCISDTSNGSNQHCGTERVWFVRLSQQFFKCKQKQMQPSSNKHELMVQRSLIKNK